LNSNANGVPSDPPEHSSAGGNSDKDPE
jgi:hypothetical protein